MPCYCPVVIAKENVRSRGTKVNGFHSDEEETEYGEKYLRPRISLTSNAFTPFLPTQLKTSGVGVQKLKDVQDLKDVGTDVPFPDQRLSDTSEDIAKNISSLDDFELAQLLGRFEDARQARLSLPRLKLGAMNSQTGLTYDANFEVEKCEVFTSSTPIRAQNYAIGGAEVNTGKSKGGQAQLAPPPHCHNTLTHLGVNLEEEVRKSRSQGFLNF